MDCENYNKTQILQLSISFNILNLFGYEYITPVLWCYFA